MLLPNLVLIRAGLLIRGPARQVAEAQTAGHFRVGRFLKQVGLCAFLLLPTVAWLWRHRAGWVACGWGRRRLGRAVGLGMLLGLGFFAAYPIAAGGAMLSLAGGPGAYAIRWAELGQRPAVVALEWSRAAVPLLLWPFLLAVYRLFSRRSQRDLALVAVGLGFLAMSLMVFSYTFNATLLHAPGQAYVDAGSEAEGTALLGTLTSLIR